MDNNEELKTRLIDLMKQEMEFTGAITADDLSKIEEIQKERMTIWHEIVQNNEIRMSRRRASF